MYKEITKDDIRVYSIKDQSFPHSVLTKVNTGHNSKAFFLRLSVDTYTKTYTLFDTLSELNEYYQQVISVNSNAECKYGAIVGENQPALTASCATTWRSQGVKYVYGTNFTNTAFMIPKLLLAPKLQQFRIEIVEIAKPIFNKQFNYDNAVIATDDYEKLMYFTDVLAMTDIYERIRTIAPYHRPLIYLNRDCVVDIEKDISKIII